MTRGYRNSGNASGGWLDVENEKKESKMIYMHCRVRVVDFSKWKSEMEADAEAQLNAGMRLIHLWRGLEEPNTAFFVLEVDSVEKARAFLNPEAVAEASKAAGVLDFEWHFVENVEGYSM